MSSDREKELTREIRALKTEIEKLKARNEAWFRLSLELRTGLTSALAYTKLLIRRRENLDPLLLAEALDSIQNELREAVRRVCDLKTLRHPSD
ncbi:MAG TPA: hypothetical protein V6C89_07435 [Drouetiella sp.]|jgi:signal transduction histidine kinase